MEQKEFIKLDNLICEVDAANMYMAIMRFNRQNSHITRDVGFVRTA